MEVFRLGDQSLGFCDGINYKDNDTWEDGLSWVSRMNEYICGFMYLAYYTSDYAKKVIDTSFGFHLTVKIMDLVDSLEVFNITKGKN